MGQRQLLIDPVVLVSFLSGPGAVMRSFTVDNALPPDCEYVSWHNVPGQHMLLLTLSSEAWEGDETTWLEPPVVTVTFRRDRRRKLKATNGTTR